MGRYRFLIGTWLNWISLPFQQIVLEVAICFCKFLSNCPPSNFMHCIAIVKGHKITTNNGPGDQSHSILIVELYQYVDWILQFRHNALKHTRFWTHIISSVMSDFSSDFVLILILPLLVYAVILCDCLNFCDLSRFCTRFFPLRNMKPCLFSLQPLLKRDIPRMGFNQFHCGWLAVSQAWKLWCYFCSNVT